MLLKLFCSTMQPRVLTAIQMWHAYFIISTLLVMVRPSFCNKETHSSTVSRIYSSVSLSLSPTAGVPGGSTRAAPRGISANTVSRSLGHQLLYSAWICPRRCEPHTYPSSSEQMNTHSCFGLHHCFALSLNMQWITVKEIYFHFLILLFNVTYPEIWTTNAFSPFFSFLSFPSHWAR